jgi:hypothetical protein
MTKCELKKLLKVNYKNHKKNYTYLFNSDEYIKLQKKLHFLATQVFNLKFECVDSIASIVFSSLNYAKMISHGSIPTEIRTNESIKTAIYICANFDFFKNSTFDIDNLHLPMWNEFIELKSSSYYIDTEGDKVDLLHFKKDEWEIFVDLLVEWVNEQ